MNKDDGGNVSLGDHDRSKHGKRNNWLHYIVGISLCVGVLLPFFVSVDLRNRVNAAINGWAIVPQHVDVGSLPVLTRSKVQFELTNISGEPVQIVGAKASCSCLVTDFGERVTIAPQTKKKFIATLNPPNAGDFQHKLLLYLSCESQQSCVVTFHGNVKEN